MERKIEELFLLAAFYCGETEKKEGEYKNKIHSYEAKSQGAENEVINYLLKKRDETERKIILLGMAEKLAQLAKDKSAAEVLKRKKQEDLWRINDEIKNELAICFMNAARN